MSPSRERTAARLLRFALRSWDDELVFLLLRSFNVPLRSAAAEATYQRLAHALEAARSL